MTVLAEPITFRKGRLPNDPTKPRLSLDAHLSGAAPGAVDNFTYVASWGMLGNDLWGDCTFAGDGHVVEQQTALGLGQEKVVTTGQCLDAYSAVTGFDPNAGPSGSNPTDNGATVQSAMEYLLRSGLAGMKVSAFAELAVTNHLNIRQAIYEFGCLSIGINLPVSAMDQFNAGQPWTVVPGSPNDGGHCVIAVGYDTSWVYVISWGAVTRMSWEFWMTYVEEAWVPISKAWVSKSGLSLTAFGEEYAKLTGKANPFPAPVVTPPVTPPAPKPAPKPAPAPVPAPPAPPEGWLARLLDWLLLIFGRG